ncbi:MAG: cobalamin-dependent protein [Thermodesulfobacteriota bacterium]|nr:cobalamin-dependent protein [Thermodesulfobacteriota bacterium]
MDDKNKTKVILGVIGLDTHDKGIKIVVSALRDAGMEVVYLGMHQSPESVITAAEQEDADVIGVSFHGGTQLVYVPVLSRLKHERQLDNMLLIVGGIFPREDIPILKSEGVDEVFMGSLPEEIIRYLEEHVRPK